MNSDILNSLGFGNIDPMYFFGGLFVVSLVGLTISIVNYKRGKKLTKRFEKFMQGKNAESLEDIITKRFESIDELIKDKKKKTLEIEEIFENLKITNQKTGIVKYDAFSEMGGKLSFALAILNKENSGFIMNAMHSREGCYTYIKEIIRGESYIPLGEEEKKALKEAME